MCVSVQCSWTLLFKCVVCSVPIDFFSRTKEDKSHEASFMTGMRQMCKGITDATPRSVHETIRKVWHI